MGVWEHLLLWASFCWSVTKEKQIKNNKMLYQSRKVMPVQLVKPTQVQTYFLQAIFQAMSNKHHLLLDDAILTCLSSFIKCKHEQNVKTLLLTTDLSPWVFTQKLSNEALSQLASAAEEFLIKFVAHSGNVCQCLLFTLAQKWGSTAQSNGVKVLNQYDQFYKDLSSTHLSAHSISVT